MFDHRLHPGIPGLQNLRLIDASTTSRHHPTSLIILEVDAMAVYSYPKHCLITTMPSPSAVPDRWPR